MSFRSESVSDLTYMDSLPLCRSPSPPPLPPRNSRLATQTSISGFPSIASKVERQRQHLRHISCTRGDESDNTLTKEGGLSPIGILPQAVQPELGLPEYSEPSVAILDPSGLWPHLEPSIRAHMPLKSLELLSPITKSRVVTNDLPIKLTVHESTESLEKTWKEASMNVWNWYKAPFAVIYVVTAADNQDYYKDHVCPKLQQFLGLQDSESIMKDGWLILYVNLTSRKAPPPEKGIDAVQSKTFGLMSANFYVKSPGDRSCFVFVCKDDSGEEKQQQPEQQQQLEEYNLSKDWDSIAMQIGTVIVDTFNARVQMYEAKLSLLEEKRTDDLGWDFSQFFLAIDALALMLGQLGLINDALFMYQELAASVIALSTTEAQTVERQKLEGDDSEFGRILFGLPSQCLPQPHPVFDLHSMAFRKRLLSRTLHSAVLEAQLYLFAREIQLLLETNSPNEMIECALSFIPAYYRQLLLRTDIVPARAELWALKASWDIVKPFSGMYEYCHKQLPQSPPSNRTAESEYSEMGGRGGGNNGGGVYETVMKDKNISSVEICGLLFFMLDRLMGCASQLSSFVRLLKSPVWEIHTCGFWIDAQTWTPDMQRHHPLEPILSPSLNAQSLTATNISEELLFWDSDEGGNAGQFNFAEIKESEVLPNPVKILSSFPMMMLNSSTIFDSTERRELDNYLHELRPIDDGTKSGTDFGSFDSSSAQSSSQCSTDDDNENNDGQEQHQQLLLHCKGLETATDLDLVYLQITHSLAKYLLKAKKYRNAAVIQQCRCDVLLSHGKWSDVIHLLEGHAYPRDIVYWPILEFHRLQRLAQCYWNMSRMDSFIATVLNMCCAYKGVITPTMTITTTRTRSAMEFDESSVSVNTLKRVLTGYVETCSSILLTTTSVNLNPSETTTSLTNIAATPKLLFDGNDDAMAVAGDECIVKCHVWSYLPCEIKICPLPILTLEVLETSHYHSNSSKREGRMEKGGYADGGGEMCLVKCILQHEHSSKGELVLIPGMNCWEFKVYPMKEGVLVGHNLTVNWGGSINLNHSFIMPRNMSVMKADTTDTTIISPRSSTIQSCDEHGHHHNEYPGQEKRQFLNIEPFIPKSSLELVVPPFIPYEETSSVFIRIISNEYTLTDVLLMFPFHQHVKVLTWEAWFDEGETTTKKQLPISIHEMETGNRNNDDCSKDHIINDRDKEKEGTYVKAIRFENPILPESVVMLKLQLMVGVTAINRWTEIKTREKSMAQDHYRPSKYVLKCCMTASHSRCNVQIPSIKCSQTIESVPIPVGTPFSSSIKGAGVTDDSITLQALLECWYDDQIDTLLNLLYLSYNAYYSWIALHYLTFSSPIALKILSSEFKFFKNYVGKSGWKFLVESFAANTGVNGQIIQLNEKMFLSTTLVKGGRTVDGEIEIASDDVDEELSSFRNPNVTVQIILKYEIQNFEGLKDEEKDMYIYELLVPLEDFYPSSSIVTITCDVIPCFNDETSQGSLRAVDDQNKNEASMIVNASVKNNAHDDHHQHLICKFGVPHSFDFTVSSNQSTSCLVLDYELETGDEWMVCGNCKGYVTLRDVDIGKHVKVIQCNLVPLKCGLVQLPRLKVVEMINC